MYYYLNDINRTTYTIRQDLELPKSSPASLIIVELLLRRHITPQDILLEVPRQHPPVMVDMLPCRNGKYLIQFLQRKGFSLRQTEIAEDPAEEVPGRIPPERTLWCKGISQTRPREGHDEVEAPGRRSGK